MATEVDQLPLNALRAFEAAGRLGSFRAAADALGITNGAVGQHVRGLEDKLGAPLFERHPRGVRLTEAGWRMHARVQQAFELLQEAVGSLKEETVPFRLAVDAALVEVWGELWSADWARHAPDVVLKTSTTGAKDADLVLSAENLPAGFQSTQAPLAAIRCIPVARPKALGAPGAHLLHDPRDLWPQYICYVMGRPRPQRLGGLRFATQTEALAAAQAGQGAALVDYLLAAPMIEQGLLEQVEPGALSTGQSYRLGVPVGKPAHDATAKVIDWLRARPEFVQAPHSIREAGE